MEKVVAGIDIGGTFTKLGIVDQEGKVYAETSISTDTHKEIGTYLEHLAGAIRNLLKEQQGKRRADALRFVIYMSIQQSLN